MTLATKHVQARAGLRSKNALTDALLPPLQRQCFLHGGHTVTLLSSLALFLTEHLSRIPDALLLIDVRRLDPAEIRGDLTDLSFIDPANRDHRLLVNLRLDPGRKKHFHRVCVSHADIDRLPLDLRLVSDSRAFEPPLIAFRDALDH